MLLRAGGYCLFVFLMLSVGSSPALASHMPDIDQWTVQMEVQQDGVIQTKHTIIFHKPFIEPVQIIIPRQYVEHSGHASIESLLVRDEEGREWPMEDMQVNESIDQHIIQVHPSQETQNTELYIEYDNHNSITTNDEDSEFDRWSAALISEYSHATINDFRVIFLLPHEYSSDEVTIQAPWASTREYHDGVILIHATHLSSIDRTPIRIEWPAGAVTLTPQTSMSHVWAILRYPYYALPFVVFIFLFIWYWKYGKDPRVDSDVQVVFDPPHNLGPASLGTLVDEKVRIQFFSAILVNLAQRGYIQIIEELRDSIFRRKEYTFVKCTNFETDKRLLPIEIHFLQSLFEDPNPGDRRKASVKLSELKNSFASHISDVRQAIMDSMVERGYFREDPTKERSQFFMIASVASLIATGVTIIGGIMYHAVTLGVPLYFVAGLFMIFAPLMPQRTMKGAAAARLARGFRKYLEHPEKYQIRPRTPEVFNSYLAYAIVFGVEKEWARGFEGILQEVPKWYLSSGENTEFSPTEFTHFLRETFIHAASQTLETTRQDLKSWPRSIIKRK